MPASVCTGAAFELVKPARESERISIGQWEIEARQGSSTVVARGGNEDNADDAFRAGLLNAQKGIDFMSIRGGNHLTIKNYEDEYITWWPESNGLTVRVTSISPLIIDTPPAKAIVIDSQGRQVPQPPLPPIQWHESFRYFRISQTTDDLFDAYRNAYLALESVLSSIAPQRTNATGRVIEREGVWFRRALTTADALTPLTPFAPKGTANPVDYLWDELYRDMRSAMSHAKSGRRILLPQNETERKDVVESLKRLVILYRKLAEVHLHARPTGGGMFAVAFQMMIKPTLEAMKVFASDDSSAFDASDTKPNPGNGQLRELSPVNAVDTTTPFLGTRLWSSPVRALAALPSIRRIVGTRDGKAMMASILNGPIILESAYKFEALLGTRGSNARQPRERYSF